MSIAIKAENISKAYQLGQIGTGTVSRDIERWFAKMRGKEDPFLKIGEANDRTQKGTSDIVWSLKDINFHINQGDAVGIIGRNGAGKSTLLKLLSRVTSPTTGNFKVKGRIASLLEVGTGFHPELTGGENIYLNGAILGMRKQEIKRKFDEIVSFSGVDRYVDTPVKRYSSGMYVRLAFAVAAHLESEILIVDEVLAVGDAEFQKKCLGKMGEVSKGEGRTVLFVSHNMGSIAQLCNKSILLKNGQLECSGTPNDVINYYLDSKVKQANFVCEGRKIGNFIKQVEFINESGRCQNDFLYTENILINNIIHLDTKVPDLTVSIIFRDNHEKPIFTSHQLINHTSGDKRYTLHLDKSKLLPGQFSIETILHIPNVQILDKTKEFLNFNIIDSGGSHSFYNNADLGCFSDPCYWTF